MAGKNRILQYLQGAGLALLLSACTTSPSPARQYASANILPDKVQFLQTDIRWARQTLGGSNESLESNGCLVTATAMALVNLGVRTNPGDLANRLKTYNGFTKNGWILWSGVERVTAGKVKTVFHNRTDPAIVRSCLASGYYPLVKFDLPGGKSHWAMVTGEMRHGFYVRDPMIRSRTPIPLASRTKSIDAVRCIGLRN